METTIIKPAPLLDIKNIAKSFPGVRALKGVSFDVYPGEVHALVGENGAGKSTLMHILAGVYQPDSGSIAVGEQANIHISNEHSAQELGIGIVFQERSLFGMMSVAENIYAGRQPGSSIAINYRQMRTDARYYLQLVGLGDVDPSTTLSYLSPAEQQMVEIAKVLSLKANIIIFDEPTSALSETETNNLFQVISRLREEGCAVIYISHRLEEIFKIAQRVTVLKDGEFQGTFDVAQTTAQELVARMVGRDIQIIPHLSTKIPATPILQVKNLSDRITSRDGQVQLRNISFEAYSGQILVFAGLAGAGRTELALSIFGYRPFSSGEILINGQKVSIRSPRDAISHGIGYLSEDRKEIGLFLAMNIAENIAITRLADFGAWWLSDHKRDATADKYRRDLAIAAPSVRKAVQQLSGGNQQKVSLAKWLLLNPNILIVDEPTRGIDVGAKSEVHQLLYRLARDEGKAIIVISSELPEVITVADRILVMAEGSIAGELSRDEASEARILQLASSQKS
jgi:ABC-type sugar transport system ATPase subunit